ncbi:MAG: hypothetical protein ACR2O6_04390 [Ilumatobacteraceae bacterium]
MTEQDPLADIFTLFAAPVAGAIRSVEQFRTGVDEFLRGVENFNRTMENLNETTERINTLLAEVEEPIRASVPQLTRSIKAADEMMQVVSGPAIAAAPAFQQIADTVATPAFQQLPERVSQFNQMMGEMSRRLGPLTQLAETAGGLLGGFRIPGAPAPSRPVEFDDDDAEPVDDEELPAPDQQTPVKKKAPKKSPAKRTAVKRKAPATKKAPKKKAAEKKAPIDPPAEDPVVPDPANPTDEDLWG